MGSSVLVIKQRSSLSLSPHLHQVLTQFSEPLSVINLIMFSLKALAVVLTVVCLTEAHSPQKRETTVTYAQTWGEVGASFISAAVSVALVSVVWFTLAPLFGLTTAGRRRETTGATTGGEYYSGYSGYDQTYDYDPYYYNYNQGRSLQESFLTKRMGSLLTSIDLVDMAFNYMDIEDETCRMKAICQAENYAVNHPVGRLAINTLNSSLRGLEKYQHAVVAGQNGEDCSLLYDQCPFSYFGLEY